MFRVIELVFRLLLDALQLKKSDKNSDLRLVVEVFLLVGMMIAGFMAQLQPQVAKQREQEQKNEVAAQRAESGRAMRMWLAHADRRTKHVSTRPALEFAKAVRQIAPPPPLQLFHDPQTDKWYAKGEVMKQPEAVRTRVRSQWLAPEDVYLRGDDTRMDYVRMLDIAGQFGTTGLRGLHVLDLAFGSRAHVNVLASAGASVHAIDADDQLRAMCAGWGGYREPAEESSPAGSLVLHFGAWPGDAKIVANVRRSLNTHGRKGFDLVTARSVLSGGVKWAEQTHPLWAGASAEQVLSELHHVLRSGGLLVLHSTAQPLYDDAQQPIAHDGERARSAFTREEFSAAGFEVLAMDVDDTEWVLRVQGLERLISPGPLRTTEVAFYTVVQKP
jgi:type II secretory pathway pseudopilin PulG